MRFYSERLGRYATWSEVDSRNAQAARALANFEVTHVGAARMLGRVQRQRRSGRYKGHGKRSRWPALLQRREIKAMRRLHWCQEMFNRIQEARARDGEFGGL